MKRVDIYIETSYKGPAKGAGAFAYLLRTKKASGEDATIDKFYRAESSTKHRSELMALMLAAGRLRESCELHIYSDCDYLKSGIEVWAPGWIDNNWLNAKGKPVANAEEWQKLLPLLESHTVTFHIKEHHEFQSWMQEGVRKTCTKNLENLMIGKR